MKSAIRNFSLRSRSCFGEVGPHSAIRKGRTAFTLMELLISIGILAVGATMAAALFPAAIKENQSSYNDTLGTIICNNALATARARLVNSTLTTCTSTTDYNTVPASLLSDADLRYPTGTTTSRRGAVIQAKKTGTTNEYYFVVVAYNETDDTPLGDVTLHQITADVPDTQDYVSVSDSDADDYVQLGTPILFDTNSEYAKVTGIVDVSGGNTQLTLDRKLNVAAGTGYDIWVVREAGATRSPAMNVLVARTSLRAN